MRAENFELGFAHRHNAIADEAAPSQTQVGELVRCVDEMLDEGKAVLVRWPGGHGRTGTMPACYLVSQGWEAEEAIAEVRSLRPGSIAPQMHRACVVEYAQRPQRGGCL